jgi:hypothetical protein
MAHKKGVGSSKNGRESHSKRLGVKIFGGQAAIPKEKRQSFFRISCSFRDNRSLSQRNNFEKLHRLWGFFYAYF